MATCDMMAMSCSPQMIHSLVKRNSWLARKPIKHMQWRYKQSPSHCVAALRAQHLEAVKPARSLTAISSLHTNGHTAETQDDGEDARNLFPKDPQYR